MILKLAQGHRDNGQLQLQKLLVSQNHHIFLKIFISQLPGYSFVSSHRFAKIFLTGKAIPGDSNQHHQTQELRTTMNLHNVYPLVN